LKVDSLSKLTQEVEKHRDNIDTIAFIWITKDGLLRIKVSSNADFWTLKAMISHASFLISCEQFDLEKMVIGGFQNEKRILVALVVILTIVGLWFVGCRFPTFEYNLG